VLEAVEDENMRPEDLREHVAAQPFRPFRIYMSDGMVFDIRHPELCIIGRSSVHIVIPDPKHAWMAERLAHCALIHITRIEPLNGRNGRGRKASRRKR
jgi:hypothetical protein